MINDANQIIDDLGGTTVVANKLNTPISTVHSWRTNGFPQWRIPLIEALAAEAGVPLT